MNVRAREGVPIIYNGWWDSSEQDKEASKKTTAPRKGGSLRRPGANLNVSATFRMDSFSTRRLKPNSIQRVGSTGRDVIRRRWLTTHDMEDLRDRTRNQSDARKKLDCIDHSHHVDAAEEVVL